MRRFLSTCSLTNVDLCPLPLERLRQPDGLQVVYVRPRGAALDDVGVVNLANAEDADRAVVEHAPVQSDVHADLGLVEAALARLPHGVLPDRRRGGRERNLRITTKVNS